MESRRESGRPLPPADKEIRDRFDGKQASRPPRVRTGLRMGVASFAVLGAAAVAGWAVGMRVFDVQSSLTRGAPPFEAAERTTPVPAFTPSAKALPQTKAVTTGARPPGRTPTNTIRAGGSRHEQTARFHLVPRLRMIPDFAWAPTKNTGGYRVEFRADSKLVLRVRTRNARLLMARARLRPGSYRWLVWRLDHRGVAVGHALVDATVAIR